jgi:hypothetical protein
MHGNLGRSRMQQDLMGIGGDCMQLHFTLNSHDLPPYSTHPDLCVCVSIIKKKKGLHIIQLTAVITAFLVSR